MLSPGPMGFRRMQHGKVLFLMPGAHPWLYQFVVPLRLMPAIAEAVGNGPDSGTWPSNTGLKPLDPRSSRPLCEPCHAAETVEVDHQVHPFTVE